MENQHRRFVKYIESYSKSPRRVNFKKNAFEIITILSAKAPDGIRKERELITNKNEHVIIGKKNRLRYVSYERNCFENE